MDQEQLSKMIEQTVLGVLYDNRDFVTESLADGIDWGDGWEKCISKAVSNSVIVSTRLSIQTVLTLLLENGTLTLSESALRPQLTVIRGGADSEPPDSKPRK